MTAKPVPSPCNSICSMDQASGWCRGCLRTLDEIAAWSTLDETAKRAVWLRLSARRVESRRRRAAIGAAPQGEGPEAA